MAAAPIWQKPASWRPRHALEFGSVQLPRKSLTPHILGSSANYSGPSMYCGAPALQCDGDEVLPPTDEAGMRRDLGCRSDLCLHSGADIESAIAERPMNAVTPDISLPSFLNF